MNIINKIISCDLDNEKKILIYGDMIIDLYKNITTNRISSECCIPVFEESDIKKKYIGGAGNVLNNLLVLNDNIHLLSIVEDKYIDSIISSENLINIHDPIYKNIIKTRYFSHNQQCFRFDSKNEYKMSTNTINKFKNKIDEILQNYSIIIISDYNTGVVNDEIVKYIISESNKINIPTIVDPKNKYDIYKNCRIIKSNKYDAEQFSNNIINNIDDAYNVCDIFLKNLNITECIITLSEKGCVYKNINNEKLYIKCKENKNCEILDVTGAGDTFISTFVIGYLNSLHISENLLLCNLFCADVIKRKYVSTVDMLEIFKENHSIFNENNCLVLKKYLKNKKVIFTSGCFDLLHDGHIEVLKKAKELGDILIVALNDDSSIKNIKGVTRPINNLNTRLSILSSIKYVDFIIIFSENTPNNIYNIIQPDILVKGDDYSIEKIKQIFPNVTDFISIPLINNISTTNIINKINKI
jgi:D-beta-D-heptose 7-phosphate kinase/D-beta-D-heptose 1-phosphate adenosyltransferase